MTIYSAYVCRNNSELIKHVLHMYAPVSEPGAPKLRVADVTWGKGVFWNAVDTTRFDFHKSDILTVPKALYDFRKLPYKDGSFDILVLDPPYAHNPGQMIVNANYKNAETTRGMYHNDIIDLYRDGLREAFRVLCAGGLAFVKCQDEIESSYQRWSHVEILRDALDIGFYAKDMFVLVQSKNPLLQHKMQQHARKNHSYLWVFRKPKERDTKELARYGIFTALRERPAPKIRVAKKAKRVARKQT
jgi:DNA modification methylase